MPDLAEQQTSPTASGLLSLRRLSGFTAGALVAATLLERWVALPSLQAVLESIVLVLALALGAQLVLRALRKVLPAAAIAFFYVTRNGNTIIVGCGTAPDWLRKHRT